MDGAWYLDQEAAIDAQVEREAEASPEQRAALEERYALSLLYHELILEGHAVEADAIERALSGSEGRDFVDGRKLDTIRSFHAALGAAAELRPRAQEIGLAELERLAGLACGEGVLELRTTDGATEQYKHDVVAPAEVPDTLRALVTDVRERFYTEHPLALALDTHHRMTRIWPWTSASAFVARLWSNTLLEAHGYFPLIFSAGHRHTYYLALHYDPRRLQRLTVEAIAEALEVRERFLRRAAP